MKNKNKTEEIFLELELECPHCKEKNSLDSCENIIFDESKEEFMQCYKCKKWF
jgi:uncharacterized protein YbaR (Trm112 family)